ncbi:MAG: hypothetical protein PHQ35_11300 [Phycisphaerae bacterium]|nr:hypothetical protein [Phycisphaerae bacterium]
MPITVKDFPSLTDDLQGIFNEVAKTKVADMKGNKIFNVFDTNRRTFDHLILHGISGIKEVTPGQDLPNIVGEEGDSITWTQRYFGGVASVTKEMRLFDLHNQMDTVVRSLSNDAFDKIDQSLADVLLYGWATSYTDVFGKSVTSTGPDAVALFSASHSNNFNSTVFSNIITDDTVNPVLSRSAIVAARKQGLTHKDPNGIVRPVNLDTIVVAPSNEDLVERIIYSPQMSGVANNDTNPLKGKIKNIIVWERLETRSDGTDTSAYWFMFDSTKVGESLNCLFAERPSLDAPDQVYKNKNWDYSCDFFFTVGLGYPAYIFGSNATGA